MARNIAALGGQCVVVGLVGKDVEGQLLENLLSGTNGIESILISDEVRSTTHKVRYVANGQQVLRVDREDPIPAGISTETALIAAALTRLDGCHAVILSDYAKGVLTDNVISAVVEAAQRRNLPVVVDPKSADLKRYSGATILTPNLREAVAALGGPMDDDSSLEMGGRILKARSGADAILITRGREGMTLVSSVDEPALHIRGHVQEVSDVVGAGDTVVAVLGLALAAGMQKTDAACLANIAAGLVVGKQGTATVALAELASRIATHAITPRFHPSLLSDDQVHPLTTALRSEGKVLGFTSGVFDILHAGHIALLQFARSFCDFLIVGLNSDASVRALRKGPNRPFNDQLDRATMVGALHSVDAVIIFDEHTPLELIQKIRPDVLVKGADYTMEGIVGATFVLSYGGEVRLAPLVPGKSSTEMIMQIKREELGNSFPADNLELGGRHHIQR